MDISKLKSERAAKFHALDVLSTKLNRSPNEDPHDLLLFERLKGELAEIDAQIRADTEQRAKRAVPVPYDPVNTSRSTPKRNLTVRSFDSEAAAYRAGRVLWAALGHQQSRDWLSSKGIALKASKEGEGVNTQGGVLVPDEYQ